MIFMNKMLLIYVNEKVNPDKAYHFVRSVMSLSAQFRGEIPNADR